MTGSRTDPNTNGAITVVARGGQFSAYLGNEDVGAEAEQLSYQIAVDAMNALFIYRYTMELEDPIHTITNILLSQIKGPLKAEKNVDRFLVILKKFERPSILIIFVCV
jgi:hypothetical protein